jgi:N-acetylglutamate synthase-like GNAT family acetyltransferase
MNEIVFRRAKPEDAAAISSVHGSSVRGLCAGFYTAHQIDSWAKPRKLVHYHDAIRDAVFYVAISDGEIVGFGQLDADEAMIRAVYVLPDHAGRGLGKMLLNKLIQEARDSGLTELKLNASLNSISFYRALGFRELESVTHQLHDGTELECVGMVKAL